VDKFLLVRQYTFFYNRSYSAIFVNESFHSVASRNQTECDAFMHRREMHKGISLQYSPETLAVFLQKFTGNTIVNNTIQYGHSIFWKKANFYLLNRVTTNVIPHSIRGHIDCFITSRARVKSNNLLHRHARHIANVGPNIDVTM
jgi:hypothetical protein